MRRRVSVGAPAAGILKTGPGLGGGAAGFERPMAMATLAIRTRAMQTPARCTRLKFPGRDLRMAVPSNPMRAGHRSRGVSLRPPIYETLSKRPPRAKREFFGAASAKDVQSRTKFP